MDSDFSQEELEYYDQEPGENYNTYYNNPNYTQSANGRHNGNRFNFENHLHEHVKA